jgi:hypothetical protein
MVDGALYRLNQYRALLETQTPVPYDRIVDIVDRSAVCCVRAVFPNWDKLCCAVVLLS